jgi:S1-C subfamily serine protease
MIEVMLATGRWCPAKLIGSDPETDLAVIRIYGQIELPQVIFGDSDLLADGEPVATVEYVRRTRRDSKPGLTPTVLGGIIRAAQPHGITYCSICSDYFTTDAGNNWGNSGAILLNRQGEVVGVDVAIVSQSNDARALGFVIPSNTAVNIVRRLISYDLECLKIQIMRENGTLTLCVEDDGIPFNPLETKEVELPCNIEGCKIGGLGIHLVKKFMDQVCYERCEGKNKLTLKKAIERN